MAEAAQDVEELERRAAMLDLRADALSDAYNRSTWYRFTAVFFPVPFVVVLLRLQLDYWHYYIAGAAYLVFAMVLYTYDGRVSDRCESARQQADKAREELAAARRSRASRSGHAVFAQNVGS
jgi:hypothetical protein